MKSIVIGSGGREHTLAWTLAKSPLITEIICIPGNGGTAIEPKCRNISLALSNTRQVVEVCLKELGSCEDNSFVVIGPEDPLAQGLTDALQAVAIPVVGPDAASARLEASKDFAKHFMNTYGVACAESKTYTDVDSALEAIRASTGPLVIKADGLAAGKGVVVTADKDVAKSTVRDFMIDKSLGSAGLKLIIEEYLEGEEVSILAAVSVNPKNKEKACIVPFVSARDHKRLKDGAQGPNTGGMGAVAPAPGFTEALFDQFEKNILQPTLKGLVAENFDYRGFIFFGLMITKNGPKLLEYNVRLGDPETQAVLPLLETDFLSLCQAIIDGSLKDISLSWKKGFVCAPVAVSDGYPGSYPKGLPISIDTEKLANKNLKILFAGVAANQRSDPSRLSKVPIALGQLVTSGGRVFAASAYAETFEGARDLAYEAIKHVQFDGMFYRKDIGMPGAAVSGFLGSK